MNIFETIARVSSGIEPYHSQFLADSLSYSLQEDRSLFHDVWKLAAPRCWETPNEARVSAEETLEGGRRIDICIQSENPRKRILGIEVKTNEGSVTPGQLKKYREDLTEKFGEYDVEVSYLTPFNREHAVDIANSLPTVSEFTKFSRCFPRSKHFSWLDIACIPWDGNELWKQHQAYVRQHISCLNQLQANLEAKKERNRDFAHFFGKELADRFFEKLSELGITGTYINLADFIDNPSFAESLTEALEILLDSPNVSRNVNKLDKFPCESRKRFLDSDYRQVHEAIFALSRRFNFVWIQGEYNYGVRTAHRKYPGGVSLLTSDGPERLLIRLKR